MGEDDGDEIGREEEGYDGDAGIDSAMEAG